MWEEGKVTLNKRGKMRLLTWRWGIARNRENMGRSKGENQEAPKPNFVRKMLK